MDPINVPEITDAWEVVMKICLRTSTVPDINCLMDYCPVSYVTASVLEIVKECHRSGGRGEAVEVGPAAEAWLEIFHPDGLRWGRVGEVLREYRPGLTLVPVSEFAETWRRVRQR